jgi:hypothetical protein
VRCAQQARSQAPRGEVNPAFLHDTFSFNETDIHPRARRRGTTTRPAAEEVGVSATLLERCIENPKWSSRSGLKPLRIRC